MIVMRIKLASRFGASSISASARGPLSTVPRRLAWPGESWVSASARLAAVTIRRSLRYKVERSEGASAMHVNDKAPEFTLPDQNGQNVSLKDFRGKTVVLFFFPKADTPG